MFMIAFRQVAMEVSLSGKGKQGLLKLIDGIAALHFKLAVVNEGDSRNASYEDTEFSYTPRLDSNRDRDLLGLLPDYLREEITFSRMNAAMFYGRVVETLTKKRVEE